MGDWQRGDGRVHALRTVLAMAFAGATLCAADAGAAVDTSEAVRSATGQWDMTLNDTNRRCHMALRPDPAAKAYALSMPAGCRRALPILADVLGWTAGSEGLRLTDASGDPVLQFTAATDPASLVAKGPEGETYNLVAADPQAHPKVIVLAQAAAPAAPAADAGTPPPAPAAAAAPTLTVADIPGRYDILRAGGKDTGCMLTLDPKAKGPKGGKKAMLAPACRDQGIVIFDPAGWRFDKTVLILTAKKGHETHLDVQADGTFQKDSKDGGAVLILRKM